MVTDEDVKKAETLKAELQKVIDHFNECEEEEEEVGNISDGVRNMKCKNCGGNVIDIVEKQLSLPCSVHQ